MRPTSWILLLLPALACQEPFGTDRHDLVGLRVAAIGARALDDDTVELGLAAVVEGRPWSQTPLQLTWHDATGLDAQQIASLGLDGGVANGPAPTIPGTGPGTLALVASDGTSTWRGTVDLPRLDGLAGERVQVGPISMGTVGRAIDSMTGDELNLQPRRDWTVEQEVDSVQVGQIARLATTAAPGARVRWMSTQPGGTFLELDDTRTDWVAASFVRDDEELEDLELEAEGARTILALALDPDRQGANGWAARELFVGEVPVGLFTTSGRFLPTDAPVDGAYVRGTLVADAGAPGGLRLTDTEPATPDDDPGTDALPCRAAVSGPFDPDWLLEQRCTTADVDGATVVVQVRP